jgi:hypothetical protein
MITSFFKSKSEKVKPVTSNGPIANKPEVPPKRHRDEDKEDLSNNNNKRVKPSTDNNTQELLSYLDRHESDEKTWRDVMEKHFASFSFDRLAKFVSSQR